MLSGLRRMACTLFPAEVIKWSSLQSAEVMLVLQEFRARGCVDCFESLVLLKKINKYAAKTETWFLSFCCYAETITHYSPSLTLLEMFTKQFSHLWCTAISLEMAASFDLLSFPSHHFFLQVSFYEAICSKYSWFVWFY